MITMSYGNIYVASVSLANPAQAVKAFIEADAYDGPSLIIAYTHCIAHGIAMDSAIEGCKEAVASGHWPVYRYDPRLAAEGKNPLQFESKEPKMKFSDYALKQNRYKILTKINPAAAEDLLGKADKITAGRYEMYKNLAAMKFGGEE